MSYKTKPYVFMGAGSGVRMLSYEFTKDRKLIISGPTGILDTISLEGAGAKRADEANIVTTLLRKASDTGDVLIEAMGKQRLCKKIKGVQAFIQAVEGTHSSLRPEAPPWYEDLAEKDLEDYVVCIPYADKILEDVYYIMYGSGQGTIKKRECDWVKKGETISTRFNVISPIDGQIVNVGSLDTHCVWDEGSDWPRNPSWGRDEGWEYTSKVKIRPLKGTVIPTNLVGIAYQNTIKDIEDVLPPTNKRTSRMNLYIKRMENPKKYMRALSVSVNILKSAQHKILPVKLSDESAGEAQHVLEPSSATAKVEEVTQHVQQPSEQPVEVGLRLSDALNVLKMSENQLTSTEELKKRFQAQIAKTDPDMATGVLKAYEILKEEIENRSRKMTDAEARDFYKYSKDEIIRQTDLLDRYTNIITNKDLAHLHEQAKKAYQVLLKIAA